MAKIATHVLLVEGYADRDFFEQVCKLFNLNPLVKVATSKDFQGIRNTKEDVFKLLPNLLKQIEAGEIERLAVVVDADKCMALVMRKRLAESVKLPQSMILPWQ